MQPIQEQARSSDLLASTAEWLIVHFGVAQGIYKLGCCHIIIGHREVLQQDSSIIGKLLVNHLPGVPAAFNRIGSWRCLQAAQKAWAGN